MKEIYMSLSKSHENLVNLHEDLGKFHENLAKSYKDLSKSYEKLVNHEEFQIRERTPLEKETIFIDENITIELIREKLGEKLKSGKSNEIKALLKKYNAEKLSNVKEEDYKTLFSDAKEL